MIQINIKFIPFLPDDSNIYLVGGTVRDILLGTPPKDYDLVTTDDPKALAEQIAEKAKSRAVALGKPGLRIYRVTAGEQTFDIAPAKGGTIESDLKKRDFTINALAVSAATGKLIDLQNGIEDLHDAKIRMVSEENLTEDPLRMLRAYRMGACLNFTIEPKTGQTISKGAFRIYTSAGERIRDELLKLFGAANSYPYLAEMDETGLLSGIFPEIEPLKHCQQNRFHDADVFAHTLSAYAHLEKGISSPETLLPDTSAAALLLESAPCVPLLKYSLLLHDLGKPETRTIDEKGTVHFYTHEAAGARIALRINHRLRFSNKDRQYVDFIIRHHLRPLFLFTAHAQNRLTRKAVSRFFLKCGHLTPDLLRHAVADSEGKGHHEKAEAFAGFAAHLMKTYFQEFLPASMAPPVIRGHDLIREFGLVPSPLFGKILAHVRAECLANNIRNRKDALEIVRNFLSLHPPLTRAPHSNKGDAF